MNQVHRVTREREDQRVRVVLLVHGERADPAVSPGSEVRGVRPAHQAPQDHRERGVCLEREACLVWTEALDQPAGQEARDHLENLERRDHRETLVGPARQDWQVYKVCPDVLEVMANRDQWDLPDQQGRMAGQVSRALRECRVYPACRALPATQDLRERLGRTARRVRPECPAHQETAVGTETPADRDLQDHPELEERRDPRDQEESKDFQVSLDPQERLVREVNQVTRVHREVQVQQVQLDQLESEVLREIGGTWVRLVCLANEDPLGPLVKMEMRELLVQKVRVDHLGL